MTGLPRVGVLIPSTDTTVEQELPALLGGRATPHFTRMLLPSVTVEGLAVMEEHAREVSGLLADIAPDVVAFTCTSGSFFRGAAAERALAADIAERTGAPVVTTASAVAAALRRRGERVRVRTPYTADITEVEAAYLRGFGLKVTSAAGLGISRDTDIAAVAPDRLLRHADGEDAADVLLMSCTNLPTLGLLPELERRTGLPVVTSNTATAEAILALLPPPTPVP